MNSNEKVASKGTLRLCVKAANVFKGVRKGKWICAESDKNRKRLKGAGKKKTPMTNKKTNTQQK